MKLFLSKEKVYKNTIEKLYEQGKAKSEAYERLERNFLKQVHIAQDVLSVDDCDNVG